MQGSMDHMPSKDFAKWVEERINENFRIGGIKKAIDGLGQDLKTKTRVWTQIQNSNFLPMIAKAHTKQQLVHAIYTIPELKIKRIRV